MRFIRNGVIAATLGTLALGGCASTDTNWNKQTIGTAIGAVAGTLIGTQIGGGSGRTLAIIAGALAGGALGNWVGANLDERDREALALSTQQALASGETVHWRSAHSGASATITPVATKVATAQAPVTRAPVIAKVDDLQLINSPYHALKSANLRAAPSTSAAKVGGFRPGQSFTALGRTSGDWIAVGRQGVLVGYVHGPLVAPAQTPSAQAVATDFDALADTQAASQGFDLDAVAPAHAVTEQVAVQTMCRTMQYELQTPNGGENRTLQACQSSDGAWELG